MSQLDELKQRIQETASSEPDRFFPVGVLEAEGFQRGTCSSCGVRFWSVNERDVCGEPDCGDGYTFINNPPTDMTFDVVSAWEAFAAFMDDRGYTPIDRYPVAARWRTDTEVVRASIYNFQPYVVSGEVDPPANPLVVPQFCFRSNDIDNVGITGRHYTGFIMAGQHAFTAPDAYRQDQYFRDMLEWVRDGMDIREHEIVIHEDAWGGGGNLGACLEFFVRGLELFNQVYMTYVVDEAADQGYRELDTKVLDMGMGLERVVWITHGSETSYEANMPQVVEKLYERTGVEPDTDMWSAFLPYAGHLNLDEVDDIEETWTDIADKIGVDVDTLQAEVLPAAALYAIADHTRCLLVALNDGLLPSNAGERHALRTMVRRCFDFIDRYDWDIDLAEVLAWHAEEFGALYPELQENLDDITQIVRHEENKYEQMTAAAERLIEELDAVDEEQLIELYDSQGITPDMLQRHGVSVTVPTDFYKRVAQRHGETVNKEPGQDRVEVGDVPATERLYWEDEYRQDFEATVLAVVNDWVVLDQTAFYPTSGGQEHDTGVLAGAAVVDVVDQDGVVLHRIDGEAPEEGATVTGSIDWDRRTRLRNHHTATHIINGAARHVLGNHVWQSGSHKSVDKARLDITHFTTLDRETVQRIEEHANRIVAEDRAVTKTVMTRSEAEKRYGFRLYQGGAVPGNEIRVVDIEDWDAEACGGTHCRSTGEVGRIRIVGTNKVQDGTIRLEYVAGEVAEEHDRYRKQIREQLQEVLDLDAEHSLESLAELFSVEIEQLPRVVNRFIAEWEERKQELDALQADINIDTADVDVAEYSDRPRDPEQLFAEWKQLEKDIEQLESVWEAELRNELAAEEETLLEQRINTEDVGLLIRIARHVVTENPDTAVVLIGETAAVGAAGEENDTDMTAVVGRYASTVQGDASFAKGFQLQDNA